MFFWNRRDRRTNTEVFDVFNGMMQELGMTVLDTILPETCRYDKELSSSGKGISDVPCCRRRQNC